VFSLSIVPTGLFLSLMHNPGTEVPGYSHLVPTGRNMANSEPVPAPSENHDMTSNVRIR